MKRSLIAIVVLIAFTILPSCSKEYTCTCHYIDASGIDRTNTGTFQGAKTKARKACEDNADYLRTIGTDVDCNL